MIKCLIIDDEPLAIELIKDHIEKIPDLEVTATTTNPLTALQIINNEPIDLVFLDIQMPVLTGIELAKSLRNPPSIIFTTAYRDYAVESYDLDVIDYLVKPINFNRFLRAVNKYFDKHTQKNRKASLPIENLASGEEKNFIYVNSNKKYHKIYFKDILYLESLKEYVSIYTKDGRVITKSTMDNIAEQLALSFLRVHRSFIVNKEKITAFTAHDIEIGEKEIPIGGSYKKIVREALLS